LRKAEFYVLILNTPDGAKNRYSSRLCARSSDTNEERVGGTAIE
jgi:hypothetical protein